MLLYASADVAYLLILHEMLMAEYKRGNQPGLQYPNSFQHIYAYTNQVWCRVFIDGAESKYNAPLTEEDLLAQKARVIAPPKVNVIRRSQ